MVRAASLWLFLLLAGVGAAVATIALVNANLYGPQQPVREYIQALKDGDGGKALGLSGATVPQGSAALLNGDALRNSMKPLSDFHIGNPSSDDQGRVKISVSYTAMEAPHSTDFWLEPAGTQWMFFNTWRFVPLQLPALEVSVVNINQAQINQTTVNLPQGRSNFVTFYPGVYDASVDTPLFTAPHHQVLVESSTESGPISLATAPNQKLTDQVNSALKKFLDNCATQEVLQPGGCPLRAFTSNRVEPPVKWKITKYPEAQISAYNGGWSIAPLVLDATVSYRQQDLVSGAFSDYTKEAKFGFSAKLGINGDDVSVTPVIDY